MVHFFIYVAICCAYCEAALQSFREGRMHCGIREAAIAALYGSIAIFSLDPHELLIFSPLPLVA